MREKLSCEIVQDLLPGYIDRLTSSETNQAVEEHLAECDSCQQMYARMKSDASDGVIQDKKEIDYLKKIRKHNRFNIIVVLVVVVVFFASYAYWQIFQVGRLMSVDDMLYYKVVYDEAKNQLDFQGAFKDGNRGYGRIEVKETDGSVKIFVYSTPVTSSHANQFAWGYSGEEEKIRQLSINDVIIWEDGEGINRKTADIYETKTDYIGEIAAAIGIPEQFGAYENEVTTSTQPYDWRFIIRHPLKTEKKENAREVMFADACVLLAMINNLDSVTWDYVTDEGQEVVTISTEDASKYVGKDIKTCGQSALELQHLLISAGLILEKNPYIENIPMGDVPYGFEIVIDGESDAVIRKYMWNYYLDDVLLNSSQCYIMNKIPVRKWADTEHIDTDFLGRRLTDEELSRLRFDLIVSDWDEKEYTVCEGEKLEVKYGESYRYVLTGSFEEGFNLTPKEEK